MRVSERNFESFRFDRSIDANFNIESRRARTPADNLWKKTTPANCGDSLDRDLLLALLARIYSIFDVGPDITGHGSYRT